MSIETRAVHSRDALPLARFFAENNSLSTLKFFNPFPLTYETAKRIAEERHKDRYYVAVENGVVLGMSMLRGWDEGFEIPSFGLLVDERHRRKGLGRLLTEFTISEARKLGVSRIRGSLYSRNVVSRKFCHSIGFRDVSRKSIIAGEDDFKIIIMLVIGRG